MAGDPLSNLRAAIGEAVAATEAETSQEPAFERPKRAEQGDYSTNAAMLLAPVAGRAAAADRRAAWPEISRRGSVRVLRSARGRRPRLREPLPLGFMAPRRASPRCSMRSGSAKSPPATPAVLLEFVSANPTGPLTAAGGRGAAFGDSLARVLEMAGHEVSREYYVNDAGTQVRTFGASIAARMAGDEPPGRRLLGCVRDRVGELS